MANGYSSIRPGSVSVFSLGKCMDIQIIDGVPIGTIRIRHPYTVVTDQVPFRPAKELYNFYWEYWYDLENDTAIIKMHGSIISMMQFRKFISLNWLD